MLKKRPFFSNCKRLGIRFHLKMNILFPFSKEKKTIVGKTGLFKFVANLCIDTHPFMSGTLP